MLLSVMEVTIMAHQTHFPDLPWGTEATQRIKEKGFRKAFVGTSRVEWKVNGLLSAQPFASFPAAST